MQDFKKIQHLQYFPKEGNSMNNMHVQSCTLYRNIDVMHVNIFYHMHMYIIQEYSWDACKCLLYAYAHYKGI